jgi:hypothetical protein
VADPATSLDELADRAAQAERRSQQLVRPVATLPAPAGGFRINTIANLLRDRAPPAWHIHGMLEFGAVGMLVGAPASGKSFIAVHAALAVASGRPFFDRATRQTGVAILAGEGHRGLTRRLAAGANEMGLDLAMLPILVSTASFGANVLADADAAAAELRRAENASGTKAELLILDTVAAHTRGDENMTEVVTAFFAVMAHAFPDRTLLLLHHTGHTAADRARGSSAFRGAVDAEFLVVRHGSAIELRCLKQKDAPEPPPLHLELVGVALDDWPRGDDGEPVTSAVLRPGRVPAPSESRAAPRGANQDKILRALRELRAEQGKRLADAGIEHGRVRVRMDAVRERSGLSRQRWHEAFDSLTAAGIVRIDAPYLELLDHALGDVGATP